MSSPSHPYPTFSCRWDPDIDLNGLGPLVRNPRNPSRRTRTRHRLLLEMLLHGEQFSTIRQIMAAYPYLRAEWEERVSAAEDRQSLLTNI